MKDSENKKPKVLILDFASEKNRGDAAMQLSIVKLAKKYFPEASFSAVTVFGTNQYPDCLSQFDHTQPDKDVPFYGGLLNTDEVFSTGEKVPRSTFFKLKKLYRLYLGLMFVSALFVRLPYRLLKPLLSKEKQLTLEEIYHTDFVLWNGRNFRSHSIWKEPLDIFELCFHPIVCLLLKKRMVCLGASVWELKSPLSRWLLSWVFSRCQLVTLREGASFAYVKNLLQASNKTANLQQVPDLSLYVLSQLGTQPEKAHENLTFGITILGKREIGADEIFKAYIAQLRQVIEKIRELGGKVVVIPQVVFAPESNEEALSKIFYDMPNGIYSFDTQSNSVADLVRAYERVDFLVASRMHSAIFALTAGTPVVAVAYDHGAKWNILRDMGLPEELVVPASSLSSTNLVTVFESAWSDRETIKKKIATTLKEKVYPKIEEHFREVRDIYESKKN